MKTLDIKIPRNFMNCAITIDNYFVADTNNSKEWDTLRFPLPDGKWHIHRTDVAPGIITLKSE